MLSIVTLCHLLEHMTKILRLLGLSREKLLRRKQRMASHIGLCLSSTQLLRLQRLNAGASNYNSGFLLKEAGTVKWFLYNDGGNDNFRVTDYNDQQGVTLGQNDTNGWGVISDDRMKRDWVNFEDALTKINSLTKVGNYRRIDPVTGEYLNDDPNKLQTGLSAQEVQSILPNSISKIRRNPEVYPDDENEYLVLHYQSVGVLAIKAIQELSAKVTALENATN